MSTSLVGSTIDTYELIKAKSLTFIPISDRPPLLGGVIRKISHQEYREVFNCTYSESVFGKIEDLLFILDNWKGACQKKRLSVNASLSFTKKVSDRLENPFQNFVISKISNIVGYGLFATENIPRNTIIALYSGKIVSSLGHVPYGFTLGLDDREFYLSISSDSCGGIGRFLQHLPRDVKKRERDLLNLYLDVDYLFKNHRKYGGTLPRECMQYMNSRQQTEEIARDVAKSEYDPDFENMVFEPPEGREQVATRNVRVQYKIVNNQPLLVLSTLYEVKKGEQLGISYGDNYWGPAKIFPELFDKKGGIFPLNLYKRKRVLASLKMGKYFINYPFDVNLSTKIETLAKSFPFFSPYHLRRLLIRGNAINAHTLGPISPTSIVFHLSKIMKSIPKKIQKLAAGAPIGLNCSLTLLRNSRPNKESDPSVETNAKNPIIAPLNSSKCS